MKKKFVVLAILMVALIVLSSALFVACDKKNNETPADDSSEETTTIDPTEGLLISNSDFKVVSTSEEGYPRTITDWTGAKTYSSGSYASSVIAGAISVDEALYNANKAAWQDDDEKNLYAKLIAGNRYGSDDEIKHALMVYMPKEGEDLGDEDATYGPTAYGYTSKSFTIASHGYYKLSVDVLTYDIAGDEANENNLPGARIYVSTDTYVEFEGINTNGEWKTYEIYIEASANASTSLTLWLGLGKYTSTYRDGLTTGYAFFDNVVLEKLGETGEADFATAVTAELADDAYLHTTTLKVPNGRFEYGTTTLSSTSAPSSWSFVTGNSSASDKAPTSLSYNAIIDTAKFADNYNLYSSTYYLKPNADDPVRTYIPAKEELEAIKTLIGNFPSNRIGTNVYMLSQQLMTAAGVKSSKQITIEKNKIYKLSIDVLTYRVHGAGVSLVLSGSDGKDIVIKGISSASSDNVLIGSEVINPDDNSYLVGSNLPGASTGGWTTYSFYIVGNAYKDYNYNMTVWLGTEGTNSNNAVSYKSYSSTSSYSTLTTYSANGTFSNGWLFIDELRLEELDDEADIPGVADGVEASDSWALDCAAEGKAAYRGIKVNLATSNLFETAGNGNDLDLSHVGAGSSVEGTAKTEQGVPNGWETNYDVTDSSNPIITGGVITSGVVRVDSEANFITDGGKGTYPDMPYEIKIQTAYMIHASKDSYYEVETAPFTIEANGFYRLSLWVKTVDIKSTSGIYVYLLNDEDETISSFTKINTEDFNEYTSDWCELTFLIRGSLDEDETMHLKFTLGTGDRWAASTLTSGAVYVSNICFATISYSTFTSTTTGTYVKSVDRTSSTTYTFTNGSFDEYNLDDDLLNPAVALSEQTALAQPTSWTISDATLDANKASSKLVAGVLALENERDNLYFNHSAQTSAVFSGIIADGVFDSFYGDETNSAAYLTSDNFDTIAGPYILAIGSTDTSVKYAVGYASSKFSLSSNGIYAVSVYVKGVGAEKASIFLTGEAATSVESGMFKIENPADEWTKYTFYINVGSTSVSVSLNLWLGFDNDYVGLDNEDAAKSVGVVFFDNVIRKSITEDEFKAAEEEIAGGETHKKAISFMTDSFDSLSDTVDSRASLSSPSGWSGSAGTDQSSSNTKAGVIYADSNYFTVNNVDGTDYVGILGKAYTLDDVTISAEEEEAIREAEDDEDKIAEAITALKEEKLVELKKNNWLPVSALNAHSGKNLLVINNMTKSAYTYTGSSLTLTANSYYKVSVWAYTYALSEDADNGAYIELYLGSADEEGNPLVFKAQAKNDWTEYVFYVKTLKTSVTSVTLKLSLGDVITGEDEDATVTGLTSGYAFFDDVTVEKTTEDAYNTAKEAESDTILVREVKEQESGESDEDNTDDNNNTKKFNLEYLWWMIPTIILGALIIVVAVVFLIKKIKKPARKQASSTSKEAIAKKHSRYDDNRE